MPAILMAVVYDRLLFFFQKLIPANSICLPSWRFGQA